MDTNTGFFLGGMAEGIAARREHDLKERTLATDTDLRERALGIQARAQGIKENTELNERIDKEIQNSMAVIAEIAKAGREAGHPPEKVALAAKPMLESIAEISAMTGRDPSALISRAKALVGLPASPNTDVAKLKADLNNGLIDQATYDAAVAKATAPGSAVTVNLGGEAAFNKKLGEQTAEEFVSRRNAALDASTSLQSTDEAMKLLDQGIITGVGADWLIAFGKGLQRIGVNVGKDSIANTEAFYSSRAQEVGRIIKLFGAGTGLSDADRDFATQAAAGKISLSEQSIRRILDINARAARNVIANYNREASQVDPNVIPMDLRIPEPPTAPAGGAQPPRRKVINGKSYVNQNGQWFEE